MAERTLHTLNVWLEAEQAPPARLLEGADLDLAVVGNGAEIPYVQALIRRECKCAVR